MTPEQVIELAKRSMVQGIAYTYTEPTIFFEYALDTMKLAKKEGMYNVWVSNGYTKPETVKEVSKYLDAINVDLKGNDGFYWDMCGGKGVGPVHESLKAYKKNGVFIEVTNLLIPTLNDSESDITGIVDWVKKNLGSNTPIHFSAFYPQYKARGVEPTPPETIEKAITIAREKGMKWVYGGNVMGKYEDTLCPKCSTVTIRRKGFSISSLKEKCPKCGEKVGLKGMEWTGKI
jgi:pyruvate formate lyase activating enzyme